ncbi:MAG: TMEM175 family protein [Niabella sp.]
MKTGRLEAFSDGVLAIVITIMVLELKVPEEGGFDALKPLIPKFISYILSFIYIGIYWNNHHHMFQIIERVNGKILWANLFLLFALSLVPFTTAWMGENQFAPDTVAMYGFNLLLNAIAYTILERLAVKNEGSESNLSKAVGNKTKEYISVVLYVSGVAMSYVNSYTSLFLYFIVALIWLIPDRRIEKRLR